MKHFATLAVPVVLASLAGAQTPVSPLQPRLVTFTSSFDPGNTATAYAQLKGAPGMKYMLFVAPHQEGGFSSGQSSLTAQGVLDANGEAFLEWPLTDLWAMPQGAALDYLAVVNGNAGPGKGKMGAANRFSNKAILPLGAPAEHCLKLDFNYTIGAIEPEAGQELTDNWGDIGLHISAENNVVGHPDKAIVFDSANPTGGDTDLGTPGTGPGNTLPLGNLLIIAENDVDANLDDFVDDPDDESGGGWMNFEFDEPVSICSTRMVDIDDNSPTRILVSFADGSPPAVLFVPNGGDNSVQYLEFSFSGVSSMRYNLGGSGAVGDIRYVPCPLELSFDETMMGLPLDLRAGTEMTDQFLIPLGVTISGLNNHNFPVEHPDKILIFDSAEPTGEDLDLATPGYGVGNDTALGKMLIIAEDDVDADSDGFVDDPDDEAFGGVMRFDFDSAVKFVGATVVDNDLVEGAFFRLLDSADTEITTVPVLSLGDNSKQVVELAEPIGGVHAVELWTSGSGALARLRWCPAGH